MRHARPRFRDALGIVFDCRMANDPAMMPPGNFMRWHGIILFAVVVLSASCTRKPERSLIGEWKGTDSTGATASLVLNADRTFKIVLGNVVVDGATYGAKSQWRVDMSHNPMTLDLFVVSPSGQEVGAIPIIFRFVTDQKIQIKVGEDIQSRPTGFSADDTRNQLVLTKQ
jgi:hypothetical protein